MIKSIVRYAVVFCLLMAFCFLFAFSSLCLPNSRIKRSIEKSVAMGDIKTDYPRAIVNKEVCRMDQYSDALILNQAYCSSKQEALRSVMIVPSIGDANNKTEWLQAAVEGVTEPIHNYPRYWHGSTFVARWVMLFCGRYANLQLFLFYTSSIAIFALFYLLCKRKKAALAICLFVSMLLLKSYLTQFSIHLCMTFAISILAAIVSLFITSRKRLGLLFFITGSLTAYFDLMTTPLLTLGIPLLVVLSDKKNDESSLGTIIKGIIIIALLWGLGYSFTWVFKWILATWLTGTNVLADALSISKYRINGDVGAEIAGRSSITVWDSLSANLSKCPLGLILPMLVVLAITACFAFNKKGVKMAVAYAFVSLFPILYYIVIANQTYVHCWFTYRALIVTVAGVLMALASLIDWTRISKRISTPRNQKKLI